MCSTQCCRFDTSLSTTYNMINRVTDFLYDLAPSVINFPRTAEEREKHARQFKEV